MGGESYGSGRCGKFVLQTILEEDAFGFGSAASHPVAPPRERRHAPSLLAQYS